MANAATEITGHGIVLCQKREVNKVRLFRCTFDTLASDLTVLAGEASKNVVLVGLQYASPNAHKLTLKSGSSQVLEFNMSANSGILKEVGNPIFVANKNEDFKLRVDTGLITDVLVWVVQSANFAVEV